MNELRIFENVEFGKIRTIVIDGEPWLVGKDVADILGYQNGSRDINRHVDEEDRQNYQNGSFESPRGMTIINESGFYSLVMGSKLPAAKRFNPLVAYAQAVSAGDDCTTIGTVAKIIEQKYHVHIGQNRLFEKMREDGILFKAPKGHKDHNRPTQYYIEAGWFVLKGSSGQTPDGKTWENFTPYVTPKGRIALVNKYGRQIAEQQTTLAYQEG